MRNSAYDLQKIILSAAANVDVDVDVIFQGHPNAMCLHASASELRYTSEWLPEMKEREEIIRQSFVRNGILIAPPCRLYPNISIDSRVFEFVDDKIGNIFTEIRKEYNEKGFSR